MKTKVVILAGKKGLQDGSLESRVPCALWPVLGTPAVERLLSGLVKQGIDDVTVCSNGSGHVIASSIDQSKYPELKFLDEPVPVGPAGCIGRAADVETDEVIVVLKSTLLSLPNISELVSLHGQNDGELTVFFGATGQRLSEAKSRLHVGASDAAGIYVCSASVLEFIPEDGFFDIKESLIPALITGGKKAYKAVLPQKVNKFRVRDGYLSSVLELLEAGEVTGLDKLDGYDNVYVGEGVVLDPEVRICGAVALLDGACIEKGAVLLGPVVVGRNVRIGANSVVSGSVVWDNLSIDRGCRISGRVVADAREISDFRFQISEEKQNSDFGGNSMDNGKKLASGQRLSEAKFDFRRTSGSRLMAGGWLLVAGGLLLVAFLWSHWPNLKDLWAMWMRSDEFSSGLLVPFLAVYILWSRRQRFAGLSIKPALIVGGLALLFAQFVRLFGTYYMYGSLERLSIVFSVSALVLMVLGWKFFWKAFSVLLFLFLMLPWPNQVQSRITQPLQVWSTNSAVFSLEVIGYDIVQEGNIIRLGDTTVAVAEACNGLRMITAFFVIIGLIVLLVERPKWEKLLVFASCLPIALLCNTVRLAITSIAFTYLEGEHWETMFHDFGGYAMMPLALGIAVFELWILKMLTTPPVEGAVAEVVSRKA